MKLLGRIFLALGVFLIVAGVSYGLHSYEWEGFTLIVTTAGGAFLFGGYLAQALQRATTAHATESDSVEEGEPHVGPTIWPLVFALSMVPLVIGALGSRWVLAVGGLVFVIAGVGWLLDVQRQWQHHYSRPSAHAVPRGPDTSVEG